MKFKKIISMLSAAMLCTSMLAAMKTDIKAEGSAQPIVGGTFVFETYIALRPGAIVPEKSFSSYEFARKGYMSANYTDLSGTMSFSGGAFNSESQIYSSVTDVSQKLSISKPESGKDIISLYDPMTSYARSEVTADLSKMTFKETGLYDFRLDQTNGDYAGAQASKTLEVNVVYDQDENGNIKKDSNGKYLLKIQSYTLYGVDMSGNPDKTHKETGFTYYYRTNSLTINSSVTGNQASHDEYFKYDVTIKKSKNAKYPVSLTGAEATTTPNGLSTSTYTNPASISSTADSDVASGTFYLKYGQSIVIQNVEIDAAYTVTADKTTLDAEKYTVTGSVTGDIANGSSTAISTGTYTGTKDSKTSTLVLGAEHAATFNLIDSTSYSGYWDADNGALFFSKQDSSGNVLSLVYNISDSGKTLTLAPASCHITGTYNSETILAALPETMSNADATITNLVSLDASYQMADTDMTGDTSLTFTNDKTGTLPTGVILNTAPYVAVVLAGFAGLILFAKKRREEE